MSEMTHAEVREVLPAYVRGGSDSLTLRRHLSACAECRNELTRYQDLLGALATMESATEEPPRGLVAALERIPQHASRVDQVRSHLARNRKTYLGGAAVLVAGAAGAVVLRSRARAVATV